MTEHIESKQNKIQKTIYVMLQITNYLHKKKLFHKQNNYAIMCVILCF